MSARTRVRRRAPSARRSRVRRVASSSALATKKEAKNRQQNDAGVMIGGAQDPAEKAADKLAEQALAGKEVDAPDKKEGVKRQCAECKNEEETQRDAKATPTVAPGSRSAPASPTAASAIKSLGAGRKLHHQERAFFESRFDHDFSSVRLHDDGKANAAAKNIDARAFTYGENIAFAKGEKERGGQTMLAHELAHVVQNNGPKKAHRQAVAQPPANCRDCPSPVNPQVDVTITPVIQNGTPGGSPFGSTNWGSAKMKQLSVWHRERQTCDTCNTAEGLKAKYQLCPRSINVLATVPIVIDRAEITRNEPATGKDWWTECGASPGADRFNTEAGTGFSDPKQKTVAGVLHHERYHVGVSEGLLRQRIQARNDIHNLCPYDASAIAAWKTTLEQTLNTDAEAFLKGNPNEANEESNASTAECTRY